MNSIDLKKLWTRKNKRKEVQNTARGEVSVSGKVPITVVVGGLTPADREGIKKNDKMGRMGKRNKRRKTNQSISLPKLS